MGISADSFHHDQVLEQTCHMFLRWHIEGTTLSIAEQRKKLKVELYAVQEAARGKGREAVRFRSPHRRLATVWEILVWDWIEFSEDKLVTASLAHCCARIVATSLSLPQDTIDRITTEARAEMSGVIARFEEEAGRSGATLTALSEAKGAA